MNGCTTLFVVVIVLIVIAVIFSKKEIKADKKEDFMVVTDAYSGALVSDLGFDTYDYKFNLDSLPRYDPTYNSMGDSFSDWTCNTPKCKRPVNDFTTKSLGFDHDCFIKWQNRKIRRDLVPANYTKDDKYVIADFENANDVAVTNPAWTKYSTVAPQGSNYYFEAGQ